MPVKKKKIFYTLIFLFLTILLCPHIVTGKSKRVAIFLSSKIRPYIQALNGIEQTLNYDFQVFDLSTNFSLAKHYSEKGNFEAAIAIGPEATKLLFNNSAIPIKISIMTLDIEKLLQRKNVCGIDLRVPIEDQLKIIKSYLGSAINIAILYNSQENQEIIEKAQRASNTLNLHLIPIEIKKTTEIMTKLTPILSKIDLILFIPDSIVVSEKIVAHIAKKALLAGVAISGYNSFFYEVGGLICFVVDYEKIGEEAVKLLNSALKNNKCSIHPPNVKILWNNKVFEILKRIRPDKWNRSEVKGGGVE